MRRYLKSAHGFTIIELVTTIGIIAILAAVATLSLLGRKGTTELSITAQQIATLLREAQSRAVSQASSTSWGVYFDNVAATSSFYAIFRGSSYSSSTEIGHHRLPPSVRYVPLSLPLGSTSSVFFASFTGAPNVPLSISVELFSGTASATISVNALGAVSF